MVSERFSPAFGDGQRAILASVRRWPASDSRQRSAMVSERHPTRRRGPAGSAFGRSGSRARRARSLRAGRRPRHTRKTGERARCPRRVTGGDRQLPAARSRGGPRARRRHPPPTGSKPTPAPVGRARQVTASAEPLLAELGTDATGKSGVSLRRKSGVSLV
jgi:hypothetical protein